MNNVDKKIEQVKDILALSIEISTTSIISVFVTYSSHIQSLDIRVYLHGWSERAKSDYKETVYLDWENGETKLKEIKDYLIHLKKEAI